MEFSVQPTTGASNDTSGCSLELLLVLDMPRILEKPSDTFRGLFRIWGTFPSCGVQFLFIAEPEL